MTRSIPETILIAEDEPEWILMLQEKLASIYVQASLSVVQWIDDAVTQTSGGFDLAIVDLGIGARSNTDQMGWGAELFGNWLLNSGTRRLILNSGDDSMLYHTQKHLQSNFPKQTIWAIPKRDLIQKLIGR